jgi:hypothetical protein
MLLVQGKLYEASGLGKADNAALLLPSMLGL